MNGDYRRYEPGKKERQMFYACSCAALFSTGMLFYRNVLPALCFCLLSIPLEGRYTEYMAARRRNRLTEGFRDALYSISSSVASGRQLPSALEDAAAQLALSWGEDSDIYREFSRICLEYKTLNGDPDAMIEDLALRSASDEIRLFASACRICRQNGGDLEDVSVKTADLLLDKLSFDSELKTMLAEKKLDILLLGSMPFIVLIFLNLSSYSYIRLLYECAAGRLIMTLSLLCICAALVWSLKITDIGL